MALRGQEKNAQPKEKFFDSFFGRSISVPFNGEDIGRKRRSGMKQAIYFRLVTGAFIELFAGFGYSGGRAKTQAAVFCMLYSNYPASDDLNPSVQRFLLYRMPTIRYRAHVRENVM
jgi:hypothetical protein